MTVEQRGEPDVSYEFGHDFSAPAAARRSLRPILRDGEDDIELVASELVANVVVHTEDGGRLQAWDNDPLRLEVDDTSQAIPVINPEPGRTGGRGLHIVDELADTWGVRPTNTGKTVWAQLPRAPVDDRGLGTAVAPPDVPGDA